MFPSANAMRDHIFATPPLLPEAFDALERMERLLLTTPEIYRTRRVVLTGSGDSLFAAKAVELAFTAHAGLPVEVRPPLEAGRYHAQLSAARDLDNTLVIAISNSGGAARVAEAAALYRRRGALVLALTRSADSRLARVASRTMQLPYLALPASPGFGPYLVTIVALLVLAIRLGEVRMSMTMDEAQARRSEIRKALAGLPRLVEAADHPAAEAGVAVAARPIAEFLGGGPSFAVAEYGAAKLLEAAGHHAYARDLEEWTHLNYFDARPEDISTVMLVPAADPSQSRAVELLAYMHKLGRQVVVIGGGPASAEATRLGHRAIAVDDGLPEIWSPLGLSAPVALLAAHFAEQTGAIYGRGSAGPWSDSADASTVQKSAIWEPGT